MIKSLRVFPPIVYLALMVKATAVSVDVVVAVAMCDVGEAVLDFDAAAVAKSDLLSHTVF